MDGGDGPGSPLGLGGSATLGPGVQGGGGGDIQVDLSSRGRNNLCPEVQTRGLQGAAQSFLVVLF